MKSTERLKQDMELTPCMTIDLKV